jgi:hypothetical protein
MTTGNEPKFEDQVRAVLRRKHYSLATEETYVGWYRRSVLWHGKRHPREMGAREVEEFLTGLAVEGTVGATSLSSSRAAVSQGRRPMITVGSLGNLGR